MGRSNLALRPTAMPYRAMWYDSSAVGNQIGTAALDVTGDLFGKLNTGSMNGGAIRLARPYKGDIIEAKLTWQAVTAFGDFAEIRFALGTFAADGVTAVAPDSATIARHHKILTGYSAALSWGSQDVIFIDGLNLTPLIPKRGDADYNEDGFVLYIEILSKYGGADTGGGAYTLYEFKVDCSVQIGVL